MNVLSSAVLVPQTLFSLFICYASGEGEDADNA